MEFKNIQAIVFDAYGTLLDISSIDQLLKELFGDKANDIGSLWRKKQLEYTWLRTLMGRYVHFDTVTLDALKFACRYNGVDLNEKMAETLMQAYDELSIFEDVSPALRKLMARYRLAVLSNANQKMLENSLKHNKVHSLFEQIISVEEALHFKPKPVVYRMAEQQLDLKRFEILFISSNTWDVAGAKSFGLKVVWGNRFNGQMEELSFEPDLIVADLEELAAHLILKEND